jgi:aquaporin Z
LHLVEWGAEFAGTGILVVGGLSAVALDFGAGTPVTRWLPSPSLRLLVTGMLFAGTGSLVAVSPLGRRSGAHINPAVTLAFWLTRHMHPHDLAGYMVAQFLGAIAGAALWRLLWGPLVVSVQDGVTMPGPGVSSAAAVAIEAGMTALLVLAIFVFVARARTMRLTPLAVWAVVTLLVWQGAPFTGTSLNPARSLGPAVASGRLGLIWVYFAGPLTGSLIAVVIAYLAAGLCWPKTAKLFHDPRYPSIFRHSPPADAANPTRARYA